MTAKPQLVLLLLLGGCAGNATQEMERADYEARVKADELTPRCASEAECNALFERALEWAAARPDRKFLNVDRKKQQFLLGRNDLLYLAVKLERTTDGGGWLKTDTVCAKTFESGCEPMSNAARLELNTAMQQPSR
jgi:hypothetical protein